MTGRSKVATFFDTLRTHGVDATALRTLEFFAYRLRQRGPEGRLAVRLFDWYYALPRSGSPVAFVGPEDVAGREVSRAALLAGGTDGPLIWRAARPETHPLHDGLLSELCHAADDRAALETCSTTSYEAPAIYFARFRDALLFPHWGVVMLDPGRIWGDSAAPARWYSPVLREVPGIFRSRGGVCFRPKLAKPTRLVEGAHLMAANWVYRNYAHWHTDCLPGVVAFEAELRAGKMRLLAPPLSSFHRQSLARLQLLEAVDEVAEPVVVCRDLIFPSHLSGSGTRRPSAAVLRVFERLKQTGPGQQARQAPALIYVSRDNRLGRRIMANESELLAALARIGFVSIDPASLGYDEQIDVFSAARMIVGPHGAGLANIGFAPSNCVILEIIPRLYLKPWIFHLTALLRQRFIYVVALVPDAGRQRARIGGAIHTHLDFSYCVNVDAVVRAVEGALDRST